jgi:transposase, IS5 family
MKAKPIIHDQTLDMFRSELESILNLQHELCKLAKQIDWNYLDNEFGKIFPSQTGCPAIATRLIVGMFFLKAIYKLSDEEAVARWVENPYWQYFCGEQYLQHKFPMSPTSFSKWRKRLKEVDLEKLLEETINVGLRTETIKKKDLQNVIADTTVQEKAITFPTDQKLYQKARELLVDSAKEHGLNLKQTYSRVGKRALFKGSNYARARQMRRAQKQTKKLKTFLGRVYRNIERQLANKPNLKPIFADLLEKTEKLLNQKKDSKNKLYSMHAPEVECIGKGKAHKRYEFGVKAGIVCTHKNNFIVGAKALPGNPYDGHTLAGALDQVERLTGIRPKDSYVDLGYRGHGETETKVHIVGHKQNKLSRVLRAALKRRAAVEPIIGHAKSDGHLGRNYLKGSAGDNFNAMMSAIGFNFRQILRKLRLFWRYFLATIFAENLILEN